MKYNQKQKVKLNQVLYEKLLRVSSGGYGEVVEFEGLGEPDAEVLAAAPHNEM